MKWRTVAESMAHSAKEVPPHAKDGILPLRVGLELGLEGLVLLELGLDVGQLLPWMFLCQLSLLKHEEAMYGAAGDARRVEKPIVIAERG